MSVTLLEDTPLVPPPELGPYRRRDYEALPDEPRCELIRGRFYLIPAPTLLHQIVVLILGNHFLGIAEATGGFAAVAPLDVPLADHSVVQPDIVYLTRARRKIIARDRLQAATDLVIEVLSPRTARRDRGEKLAIYAEAGVKEYWMVLAEWRMFEFLINDLGSFKVTVPKGALYTSPVLPEVKLDLVAFWERVARMLSGPEVESPEPPDSEVVPG
jgi:Uma2 family endonuclease